MKIKFGAKVKDSVTGFVGFVVARCEYMNGCVQYEIEPATLKDGVPQKSIWLDEQRVIPAQKAQKKELKKESSYIPYRPHHGGPQNHPEQQNPPSLAGYEEDVEN